MTGPCIRCTAVGPVFRVVNRDGLIVAICAACLDRRRERSGDWGIRSQWAARKLPTSENTTRRMAGRRRR